MKTVAHIMITLFISGALSCGLFKSSGKTGVMIIPDNGFVPDADSMLNAAMPELSIYDLRAKETIADIGFGPGWLEGIVLLHYDSITIYAEEIDRYSLKMLDRHVNKYLELRKTPNTNKLIKVKGRKTATSLPEDSFDRVIVRETFHHFSRPDEMLQDIRKILKQNGKLFVYEPDVNKTFYDKNDKAMNYSREDILKIFADNKFNLLEEHNLRGNPGNMPPWCTLRKQDVVPKKIYVFSK